MLATGPLLSQSPAESSQEAGPSPIDRVLMFVWDGTQQQHFLDLYDAGLLPRIRGLVESGGILRTDAVINSVTCLPGDGDGYDAETGPANSAIQTGYGSDVTGYVDNLEQVVIPEGLTFFERVKGFDPGVATGYLTSKNFDFWPTTPMSNAFSTSVDRVYQSATSNVRVADEAVAFLQDYAESPFYLTVHYRHPDEAGHDYGENSGEYDAELMNVDYETGRVLDELVSQGLTERTAVVVTTDHGFGEGRSGVQAHEACSPENKDLFLVGYPEWVVGDLTRPAFHTSIVPTLFDLFGMDKDVTPTFPSQSLALLPLAAETPLFADGFEAGDASEWQ